MSAEELIANAKDKCATCLASFRNDLVDAIDSQGSPICSIDGKTLKSATSGKIIALIKEINALANISERRPIPAGSFTIELSYLNISGPLLPENILTILNLDFKGSIFEDNFSISSVTHATCFDYVIFRKETTFEGIHQSGFCNTTFESQASFKKLQMGSDAIFHGAKFNSEVNFDFFIKGRTDFSGAIFSEIADFTGCSLGKDADFSAAIFHKRAIFKNVVFNYVDFSSTHFNSGADFSDSKFQATSRFTKTKFSKPPLFHEAEVHKDTSFYNAKFTSFETEEDWRAYRTLKSMMGTFRATEEEGRFFAYELRTRRNLDIENCWLSIPGNISDLYCKMSDYGENISRALGSFIVINGYFLGWYWWLGGISPADYTQDTWLSKLPTYLGLTLQNAVNPLAIISKNAPFLVCNKWVAMLSILQSVLSFSAAALLFLAIRRRFHKGNGQ